MQDSDVQIPFLPKRKRVKKPSAASAAERPVDKARYHGTLIARGLTKSYRSRRVVNGVSLVVRRGEAVGLLGPNGAGKTTCFYMITGLVPVDEGSIEINGNDVTTMPMYRRARLGVGYLPQEASIFRGLTVEDNIRAVLEIHDKNVERRESKLNDLLGEFSITHLRKSPAIALSGGERRRLEIARALATDPTFMLLDEPFAGVDPISVADIQALVRHLTSRGIGVLITDHNVRETLGLIDRAYIIHAGEVLTHGRANDIVTDPDVRRLYLGDNFSL
jgi:lipopolysaccharide export system ATP-binding protein